MYEAKIIADSVSPANIRVTTLQVTFPRFILAEFNTHRMLSRNSASSRAIPVAKRVEEVRTHPFVPDQFGRFKKGMRAGPPLEGVEAQQAKRAWLEAKDAAVLWASRLALLGVHKQLANRLLEPFAWHTAVVTATDWDNFFHLRCHPDAQPEFQCAATMMRDTLAESQPQLKDYDEWHLPYISPAEENYLTIHECRLVSVARCARVSVKTFDGTTDLQADLRLTRDKLLPSGHMSPLEHVATPMQDPDKYWGNFRGWMQYRKLFEFEHDPLGPRPNT